MRSSQREDHTTNQVYRAPTRLTEEILTRVAKDGDGVGELAAALVAIPSENPPGDGVGVMAFAEKLLYDAGLTVERVNPGLGRANLVATVDSERPGPHVILNAHLDTFPIGDPNSWIRPPQARTIEDDAI